MTQLATNKLFADGPKIYLLGIGTTWLGRPWPPDDPSYTYPQEAEIAGYLDKVFSKMSDRSLRIMIDTSSSYGTAEEKLGRYFKTRKELRSQSLIATKWGEEFNPLNSECRLDHSVKQLKKSLQHSFSYLKKIDILYIHRTNNTVLTNKDVIDQMQKEKRTGNIAYIGASFSNEKTLAQAVLENLTSWCDIIQMPASVFLKRPDLITKIADRPTAMVVNSPIRKGADKEPGEIYRELIAQKKIAAILTGSRTHLEETLDYFSSFKSK